MFQAKTEEQVLSEKQFLDAEKVWLMHRSGFTAARKDATTRTEPGKLTIKLEQTGEVLTVDEDDVEKVSDGNYMEKCFYCDDLFVSVNGIFRD